MNASSAPRISRKVIIIGSGLHKEVLRNTSDPLSDWSRLLKRVAAQIDCSLKTEDCEEPTLAWEKLLSRLIEKKRGKPAANQAEKELKKVVAKTLDIESRENRAIYNEHPVAQQIASFLGHGGGHLISLNFDQLAYAAHADRPYRAESKRGAVPVSEADSGLLYCRVDIPGVGKSGAMVWHPHGCIKEPESITLGYRDYGMLPASYVYAFAQFKKWERLRAGRGGKSDRKMGSDYHRRVLDALEDLDRGPRDEIDRAADNWVTRFMLLPVEVIGAEISAHELGLRWLFVQRQRNLQRVSGASAPVFHRRSLQIALPWKSSVVEHASWPAAWSAVFGGGAPLLCADGGEGRKRAKSQRGSP